MESPTRHVRQLLAYCLALVALIGASWLAASGAFALYNLLPPRTQLADWTGPVLDIVAPGLSGLLVSALLIQWLRSSRIYVPSLQGHFVRAVPWYGFVAWVLWVTYLNRANTDFGLWKQVIQWPLAATVVAIAYDLIATAYLARHQTAAAAAV